MKKLIFEPVFDSSVEQTWAFFSEIEHYPKYIKYSHSTYLDGDFKEDSIWYEWTTVMYLPMKIKHRIKKVTLLEEIIYHVEFPAGEIWQKLNFEDLSGKTKVKAEITIKFHHFLLEKIIGPLVYKRNISMVEASINNFKESLINGNN